MKEMELAFHMSTVQYNQEVQILVCGYGYKMDDF